jgi:hypothetical protein
MTRLGIRRHRVKEAYVPPFRLRALARTNKTAPSGILRSGAVPIEASFVASFIERQLYFEERTQGCLILIVRNGSGCDLFSSCPAAKSP